MDTADVYSAGESEEIVGKALAAGKRDDVVLATKVGFPMGDDPSRRGASRRRIIRGVEDSLRRLNTDWIDLYQIHRLDGAVVRQQDLLAIQLRTVAASQAPQPRPAALPERWSALDASRRRSYPAWASAPGCVTGALNV